MPQKRTRKSDEGDKYLKPSSKKFRAPKSSEKAEQEEVTAVIKQLNQVKVKNDHQSLVHLLKLFFFHF